MKRRLDQIYAEINRPEFIPLDPVKFPHRYKNRRDKEISAFLAATIGWGRREMILKSAEKMFALMGKSPYDFIMEGNYQNLKDRSIHRTFFEHDLKYFCRGLKNCYTRYGDLETIFAAPPDLWEGIKLFRETMAGGNRQPRYSKHIADPDKNSACKRLFLALRWLIRREGPVDLGLWQKIQPAALFIPLDVHVGRTARFLGLLEQRPAANNKKAVISLTEKLRTFCPEDPVKYDFSLFGYHLSAQ